MLTALKIATRKSPLALHQANFVRGRLLELYPAIDIVLLKVRTQGDRYLDTPLGGLGARGSSSRSWNRRFWTAPPIWPCIP